MAKTKKKKNTSMINLNGRRNIIEKSKPILGIDIGSSTLKIIKMNKNHTLGKWVLETIPTGMINQGRIEAIEPLAEIIGKALKTYGIRIKNCALYVSGSEVIVRELLLPEMSDSQLKDNVKQEIESMLPLEHGEYCIDYKVLEYIKNEESGDIGQVRVLAAAVPKEMVDDYILTMKRVGLKVSYIDVLPNIAGKLCKYIERNNSRIQRNICMIDFGAKKTEIIIMRDGNYYLHKMISYGGEYLTSSIASKSGMDLIDAEEYKCRTNFFQGDENDPINRQVFDYFDFLLRDFERTMEFYSNRNHQKVDRIYLMGGGALLEGLAKFIEEQLSIEVRLISDVFEEYQRVGAIGRHISVFSQAIGTTFREEWKYEG
jgi:type IV pilus assembly protein PilM